MEENYQWLRDSIKPCPFCGGEPEFIKDEKYPATKGNPKPTVGEIRCKDCHCTTGKRASLKTCVQYWNIRHCRFSDPLPPDEESDGFWRCKECGCRLWRNLNKAIYNSTRFCPSCGVQVHP